MGASACHAPHLSTSDCDSTDSGCSVLPEFATTMRWLAAGWRLWPVAPAPLALPPLPPAAAAAMGLAGTRGEDDSAKPAPDCQLLRLVLGARGRKQLLQGEQQVVLCDSCVQASCKCTVIVVLLFSMACSP